MKTSEIRKSFLNYFERQNHKLVASSSLVPSNDQSLLFTNAGMVQFKEIFLGKKSCKYLRATSSQRCIRAGGKHNDLENVGYTARHHTFFEMLGNFSFGDYFKHEAIIFAWKFLTEELGLPEDRLWITVHETDSEAEKIWLNEVGVNPERISRLGEDNFWQMGETGPCGPCSEIFYDHGEEVLGGPPGSKDDDLDRYIEIWNLVFMQYEKKPDGTLENLPCPSVDTGMGLERITAVMQGVHNNYEIDIFKFLLKSAAKATNTKDLENKSLRVIADHIRSCSFLIIDGVLPSNEGRGYVLRRIIRRAIRHGSRLGQKQPFFHSLVSDLCSIMGEAYPELIKASNSVEKILLKEEQQFQKTLDKGISLLDSFLAKLNDSVIPGDIVFTLYDTYGFPVDLVNDIAREKDLSLDMYGYEKCMEAQRSKARSVGKFNIEHTQDFELEGKTDFTGFGTTKVKGNIIAIISNGTPVDRIREGDEASIVLDSTPFYAESGGQVGDHGTLIANSFEFSVTDCQKKGEHFLHIGILSKGSMSLGQKVDSIVNMNLRSAIAINHSATHLLHAALREILGDDVLQKGSLVDSNRLRFDFSHPKALSTSQKKTIENVVNREIRRNTSIITEICDIKTAKEKGAMSLFGEKYGDEVRVLKMGDGFSIELCGGTHVVRTGDIGILKIISESGVAAGVRRIEAITGEAVLTHFDKLEQDLENISTSLKTSPENILEKVQSLLVELKELEKQNTRLQSKISSIAGSDLISQARKIEDIKVLSVVVEGVDPKTLRDTVDQVKSKLTKSVIILAVAQGDKIALVSGLTPAIPENIHAGDLMRFVTSQLDGKGGGRRDMAQGGGTKIDALPGAMNSVFDWVKEKLID
jgi:alanyl-tRNA synthetase